MPARRSSESSGGRSYSSGSSTEVLHTAEVPQAHREAHILPDPPRQVLQAAEDLLPQLILREEGDKKGLHGYY